MYKVRQIWQPLYTIFAFFKVNPILKQPIQLRLNTVDLLACVLLVFDKDEFVNGDIQQMSISEIFRVVEGSLNHQEGR